MKSFRLMQVRVVAIGLILSVFGKPVLAQGTADQGNEPLDEIVVNAMRSNKPASAIPQTITLIEQAQLDVQLSVAPDLSSVLEKLVPGYSPSRQKITNGGETLRGRKPLILVDGVPQSNPLRDGSRAGFTIDPEAVGRIEVIHGSNAIQGLGATGGIINYVTKSPDMSGDLTQTVSFKGSFSDEFDTDGYGYRAYYSIGQKVDKFDFLVSASYEYRPLQYDGNGNTIGIDFTSGDTADSNATNFFGKFGYDIDANQRVQFMINNFSIVASDKWVASGGNLALGIPTIAIEGVVEGILPENETWTASLGYTHDDFAGGFLSVVAYYQDFGGVFGGGTFGSFQDPAIAPIGTLYDQTKIVSEKQGFRVTYVKGDLFDSGIDATIGIDLATDSSAQALMLTGRNRVPLIEYEGLTPFLQVDKTFFDSLTLSGGMRFENAELVVPDFRTVAGATRRLDPSDPRYYTETAVAGGAPNFDANMFNFGAVYDFSDQFTVFASYSEGFTMADVGRAIRDLNEPGIRIDDYLDVEPVIVDTTEIGFRYDGGKFSFKTSFFWSESELGADLISNLDDEGSVRIERKRVEIEGYEVASNYQVSDSLNLGGHYSRSTGKSDSDGDGSVDQKLDGLDISPAKLALYADYVFSDQIDTRVQLTSFLDADYDDANSRGDFDGYTIVDLIMNVGLPVGRLNIAVENLADEYYLSHFSQTFAPDSRIFAGRGRTVSVKYVLEF